MSECEDHRQHVARLRGDWLRNVDKLTNQHKPYATNPFAIQLHADAAYGEDTALLYYIHEKHKQSGLSSTSIGENIKLLIDRPDGTYCFRYHRDRVYYCKESLMKFACNIGRDGLISFGTIFGKFTKTGKFRLHVTALDFLAPYAKYKVWLKSTAEQTFLYGHHIMKSGLGRITENTEQYQGIVVYNMSDIPLGFGVAAKSTAQCRTSDPMNIVIFHQADIGQYIREEDTLT